MEIQKTKNRQTNFKKESWRTYITGFQDISQSNNNQDSVVV